MPADSLFSYWVALQNQRTFESRDGTLDALVASGRLDTISDRELRELLMSWGPLLADAAKEAALIRTHGQQVVLSCFKWEPRGLRGSVSQEEMASTLIGSLQDREVTSFVRLKESTVGAPIRTH